MRGVDPQPGPRPLGDQVGLLEGLRPDVDQQPCRIRAELRHLAGRALAQEPGRRRLDEQAPGQHRDDEAGDHRRAPRTRCRPGPRATSRAVTTATPASERWSVTRREADTPTRASSDGRRRPRRHQRSVSASSRMLIGTLSPNFQVAGSASAALPWPIPTLIARPRPVPARRRRIRREVAGRDVDEGRHDGQDGDRRGHRLADREDEPVDPVAEQLAERPEPGDPGQQDQQPVPGDRVRHEGERDDADQVDELELAGTTGTAVSNATPAKRRRREGGHPPATAPSGRGMSPGGSRGGAVVTRNARRACGARWGRPPAPPAHGVPDLQGQQASRCAAPRSSGRSRARQQPPDRAAVEQLRGERVPVGEPVAGHVPQAGPEPVVQRDAEADLGPVDDVVRQHGAGRPAAGPTCRCRTAVSPATAGRRPARRRPGRGTAGAARPRPPWTSGRPARAGCPAASRRGRRRASG